MNERLCHSRRNVSPKIQHPLAVFLVAVLDSWLAPIGEEQIIGQDDVIDFRKKRRDNGRDSVYRPRYLPRADLPVGFHKKTKRIAVFPADAKRHHEQRKPPSLISVERAHVIIKVRRLESERERPVNLSANFGPQLFKLCVFFNLLCRFPHKSALIDKAPAVSKRSPFICVPLACHREMHPD